MCYKLQTIEKAYNLIKKNAKLHGKIIKLEKQWPLYEEWITSGVKTWKTSDAGNKYRYALSDNCMEAFGNDYQNQDFDQFYWKLWDYSDNCEVQKFLFKGNWQSLKRLYDVKRWEHDSIDNMQGYFNKEIKDTPEIQIYQNMIYEKTFFDEEFIKKYLSKPYENYAAALQNVKYVLFSKCRETRKDITFEDWFGTGRIHIAEFHITVIDAMYELRDFARFDLSSAQKRFLEARIWYLKDAVINCVNMEKIEKENE